MSASIIDAAWRLPRLWMSISVFGLRARAVCTALCLVVLSAGAAVAETSPAVWSALSQGGHAVLLRHSTTNEGGGEPAGFRFGVCETERQLNEAGRAKARRIGAEFDERGIRFTAVLSSAWCRCVDTARLALGRVEVWPALNVLNPGFNPLMDAPAQNQAVIDRIATLRPGENLFMSTHWLNINALTGGDPREGDGVVVRFDQASRRLVVVGPLIFR